MGATVWLGNPSGVDHVRTGEVDERGEHVTARTPLDGERVTTVHLADGDDPAVTVAHLWPYHSDADGPAWVASTDPDVAQVLGARFRCNVVAASEVPGVD